MTMTNPVLVGDGKKPISKSGPWAVNFHSDDFLAGSDLNQELKTAPDAGQATYITHVTMGVVGNTLNGYVIDCRLSLIDGGDASIAFGPIHFQEWGQSVFSKDFDSPLKITDNRALDLTGVGTGSGNYYSACFVYIEGFTGQKPI